jgi:hypothetical protein
METLNTTKNTDLPAQGAPLPVNETKLTAEKVPYDALFYSFTKSAEDNKALTDEATDLRRKLAVTEGRLQALQDGSKREKDLSERETQCGLLSKAIKVFSKKDFSGTNIPAEVIMAILQAFSSKENIGPLREVLEKEFGGLHENLAEQQKELAELRKKLDDAKSVAVASTMQKRPLKTPVCSRVSSSSTPRPSIKTSSCAHRSSNPAQASKGAKFSDKVKDSAKVSEKASQNAKHSKQPWKKATRKLQKKVTHINACIPVTKPVFCAVTKKESGDMHTTFHSSSGTAMKGNFLPDEDFKQVFNRKEISNGTIFFNKKEKKTELTDHRGQRFHTKIGKNPTMWLHHNEDEFRFQKGSRRPRWTAVFGKDEQKWYVRTMSTYDGVINCSFTGPPREVCIPVEDANEGASAGQTIKEFYEKTLSRSKEVASALSNLKGEPISDSESGSDPDSDPDSTGDSTGDSAKDTAEVKKSTKDPDPDPDSEPDRHLDWGLDSNEDSTGQEEE